MPIISDYLKKIIDQDPNFMNIYEHYGCSLPNDYIDHSELSSEVKPYKLSDEELKKYREGDY